LTKCAFFFFLVLLQKKLSIPTTVSQVLKYIPELQKQVDDLERKKKELTSANCKLGLSKTSESIAPVVSATCINDMEIMFQVSLPTNLAATTLPLSKCIKLLENEDVQLISSSTHSTFENRTFYSLHLQVHDYCFSFLMLLPFFNLIDGIYFICLICSKLIT
jgi:hypothetical protein